MVGSKLSFFFGVFLLITVGAFVAALEAQDTEENSNVLQGFVIKAHEHIGRGEIEEAIELYKRIVVAAPKDAESQLQLATLYSDTKQYEKAAQVYSKLLEADPNNIEYQDKLVYSTQAAGKYNEALDIAQAYIKAYPKIGVHYVRLAKLYETAGDETEAIKNYKQATTFGFDDKEIYLKLAEHYFLNEDLAAAENALKNALRNSTSHWDRQEIDRQLIKLYRSQGNLEEMLLKAEADGTISFVMQKELARLLLNTGEVEKGIDAFKKAHEMTKADWEQRYVDEALIGACLRHDRADLALEFYEDVAAKKSRTKIGSTWSYGPTSGLTVIFGSDEIRRVLISSYKNQGKLSDLSTHYEGRLKEDVDNPEFLQLLAEIYWDGDDYKKSAEAYYKITKVEPNNVHCIYHAAVAFKKSNQPDIIETLLHQAEAALATSPYKQDYRYLGALATICLNGEIYTPAIKLTENAIQTTNPDFYSVVNLNELLARIYLGAKRYQEAYEAYQLMAIVTDESGKLKRAETGMMKAAQAGNLKVEKMLNESMQIWKVAHSYEREEIIKDAIEQYEKLVELEPENSLWFKKLGELYQKQLLSKTHETGEVIVGTALTLNGNGSFVEINDNETLNKITEQVTVSAWIKATDFPNSYVGIVGRSDERGPDLSIVDNRSYVLYLTDNGSIHIAASPNGLHQTSFYSATGSIRLNTWYHIACVIDPLNDFMKLFIDGIEVGNISFKGQKRLYRSRLPLRIGSTHEEERPNQSSFVGQIDDVRIWNIARTGDEISSDMNKQLNGDEPGLVAYWKFDEETEGRIFDSTPNKNDGILIRNARIEPYTRPIYESLRQDRLAKSISAYEKAVELKPTSYELYDLLAKTYIKAAQPSQAEAMYRKALDALLTQDDYETALLALIELYDGEGQENKHIAILEDIRQKSLKMENSAVLHEFLGDLYKNIGESDKAAHAYDKWLQIRKEALISEQSASSYRKAAEKLLEKGLYPETAQNFAKIAFQNSTGSYYAYPATLGLACIANGLYDEALKHYKYAFSLISDEPYSEMFWEELTETIKHVNDKERYVQMLDKLLNSIPSANSYVRANIYRTITEYYSKNNMPDKAMVLMRETGTIHENAWLVLGPYDNRAGIGYNTKYIPENTTEIDQTVKYEGVDGQISWIKHSDDAFDGFIDFGEDVNWRVSYALATVISSDEREVFFRFSSDDQSKIWLNGKEIFAYADPQTTILDRHAIPVTLTAGKNTILVKVCNEEMSSGFYLRVTDADGKPFGDVKVNYAQDN